MTEKRNPTLKIFVAVLMTLTTLANLFVVATAIIGDVEVKFLIIFILCGLGMTYYTISLWVYILKNPNI